MTVIPKLLSNIGVQDEYREESIRYLYPAFFYSLISFIFGFINCQLLAMGYAILPTLIQVVAIVLTIGIDFLFIYGFHVTIGWMGLASVSGPTLVCLFMFMLFVFNRFSVKPVWKAFFQKPSSDFWEALKLAIPMIIMITLILPCPIVVSGFFVQAAKNINKEKIITTVYSTANKAYNILVACTTGAMTGFVPAATWAYTKRDYSRVTKLAFNTLILPGILIASVWPLMIFKPKTILKIWIDDQEMLSWAPKLAPIVFYTIVFDPSSYILSMLLLLTKHEILCSLGMILRNVVLLLSGVILYETNKFRPWNILYSSTCQDLAYLLTNLLCVLFTIRRQRRELDDYQQISSNLLSEEN